MKAQITCPACKSPWINTEGKWNICIDCPYRDVCEVHDIEAKIVSAENNGNDNDEVTISSKVEVIFKLVGDRLYLGCDITEAVEFYNTEKDKSSRRAREEADMVFGGMRNDD